MWLCVRCRHTGVVLGGKPPAHHLGHERLDLPLEREQGQIYWDAVATGTVGIASIVIT